MKISRAILIATVVAVLMSIHSVAAVQAHVPSPSDACYYGSTVSHSKSFYRYYENSSDYSRITSRVDYQPGYTCVGQLIQVRVVYRKVTFTYAYPDPLTHTITAYNIDHDSYTGNHVSLNNLLNPNTNCFGACTVSASTGTDVIVEYNYTTNEAYIFIKNSTPEGQPADFPAYHCFIRNTIGLSLCG